LLWRFGFGHTNVVRHIQRYRSDDGDMLDVPYFTMVAQRVSASDGMQVPQLSLGARGDQTLHPRRLSALAQALYEKAHRR
jgi:hypothetical protein